MVIVKKWKIISFKPIPSKPLLKDFHGALGSHCHYQFCRWPFLSLASITGQQKPMLPSLLLMNSEMSYRALVTLSLLPHLGEGRGRFPYNLLPVPSFGKSLSRPLF